MKIGYMVTGIGAALFIGAIVYLGMKYRAIKQAVRSMKPIELGLCKEANGVRVQPLVLEVRNDSIFNLEIEMPSVSMIAPNGILLAQSALNSNPIVIPSKSTKNIPIDMIIRFNEMWDKDCKNGAIKDMNTVEATFHISTIWNHLEFEKTLIPNQSV